MATVTMKAPAPGGLSNKARELMEAINADAGKHNVWVRTQANARATPMVQRDLRRRLRPARQRPRRRQPVEDRSVSVEVERIFRLPQADFRDRAKGRRLRRSSSPTGRASCSSIPALTDACRSPTPSAAPSRSIIRATLRRCICIRRTPAARSCPKRAATPSSKASAVTAEPRRSDPDARTAPGTTMATTAESR